MTLSVRNAGHGAVDVEGATAGWLGSTVRELPQRVDGGSALTLSFTQAVPQQSLSRPIVVSVYLASGRTVTKTFKLGDSDLAAASRGALETDSGLGTLLIEYEDPEGGLSDE